MVTIYADIFSKEPKYIEVETALKRIKEGKSKAIIDEIRKQTSKEAADKLKLKLPSVCFSGIFSERKDEKLESHSGLLVLDFDEVKNMPEKFASILEKDFVYAMWISPRGNGLKVLVKIADGKKHREHFNALRDIFPDADRSGVNESRVCYESYDPNIYINPNPKTFNKIKIIERVTITESQKDAYEIFKRILVWLSKKGDAFVQGERNTFIFKLASACCRFGIMEDECLHFCNSEFLANDNTFTRNECERAIKSGYRANKGKFSSATFDKEVLIDKTTHKEIEVDASVFDESIRPKDVIYAHEVKENALKIFHTGYESVEGIYCESLDKLFKMKRCELSLLSGIGNYGKSQFMKWYILNQVILHKRKFAIFAPEDNPAEEFYHDLTEILIGDDCTPRNPFKVDEQTYLNAYNFVSEHIFYIYPKDASPTPAYIKERFLELIIKEKVDGCIIDPFNQLMNDYASSGNRDDKYLEAILGDFDRFANINNVFFLIIAHPKAMHKDAAGNYPCPDVFDLSGGAMWNNKMYNILIYHRPAHQKDPQSPICELHTKKIKRQKIVGEKGTLEFEYARRIRRYIFDGLDPIKNNMDIMNMSFYDTPF